MNAFVFSFEVEKIKLPQKAWEVKITPSGDKVVFSFTPQKALETHLACLDFASGTWAWQTSCFQNIWAHLHSASERHLMVTFYKDHSNPIPAGLGIVDLAKGEVVYQSHSYEFADWLTTGELLLKMRTMEHYYCLNLSNYTLKPYHEEKVQELSQNLLNPVFYIAGEPHFETLVAYAQAFLGQEAVWGGDYLEYEDKLYLSLYLKENEGVVNKLFVLDRQGNTLFCDILAESLQAPGANTFVLIGGKLAYLREQGTYWCKQR